METKRQRQVASTIQRNFSTVLQQEGIYIYGSQALVTVTQVKMTPDLGLARVYLSVYNTEEKQALILQMENEMSRLRQGLATRVRRHLRRVPLLEFYLDDTLDEMYRINEIFTDLKKDNQMGKDEEK